MKYITYKIKFGVLKIPTGNSILQLSATHRPRNDRSAKQSRKATHHVSYPSKATNHNSYQEATNQCFLRGSQIPPSRRVS